MIPAERTSKTMGMHVGIHSFDELHPCIVLIQMSPGLPRGGTPLAIWLPPVTWKRMLCTIIRVEFSHLMNFIHWDYGSKVLRESLVEDTPLSHLAGPCDLEKSAAHHSRHMYILSFPESYLNLPEESKDIIQSTVLRQHIVTDVSQINPHKCVISTHLNLGQSL